MIVRRRVLACYECNHRRGVRDTLETYRDAHIERSGGRFPLHKKPSRERKACLKELRLRAEKDINGLVSVMGTPLAMIGLVGRVAGQKNKEPNAWTR
jgi:hypothetical protein